MIGHDAKSVRSTTSSREPPTRHTYSAQCGYWSKHPPPICLSECLSETPSLVSGRRRQGYACRSKTRAVAGLLLDSVSDWPKTLALLRRLLRINHVVDPHRARVLWSACPQRGCPRNDQVVLWSTQLLRLGCGERHNLAPTLGLRKHRRPPRSEGRPDLDITVVPFRTLFPWRDTSDKRQLSNYFIQHYIIHLCTSFRPQGLRISLTISSTICTSSLAWVKDMTAV